MLLQTTQAQKAHLRSDNSSVDALACPVHRIEVVMGLDSDPMFAEAASLPPVPEKGVQPASEVNDDVLLVGHHAEECSPHGFLSGLLIADLSLLEGCVFARPIDPTYLLAAPWQPYARDDEAQLSSWDPTCEFGPFRDATLSGPSPIADLISAAQSGADYIAAQLGATEPTSPHGLNGCATLSVVEPAPFGTGLTSPPPGSPASPSVVADPVGDFISSISSRVTTPILSSPPKLRVSRVPDYSVVPRRSTRLVGKPRAGNPEVQATNVML